MHFQDFPGSLLGKAQVFFPAFYRVIGNIFRMVPNPFDIADYMEQAANALGIHHRKLELVNFYQIVRQLMAQKVNLLFRFINPCNLFFIPVEKGFHGKAQVFNCHGPHPLNFLRCFHNCSRRGKNILFPNIEKLEFLVAFVLPRHQLLSQRHKLGGQGQEHYSLENFKQGICICHAPAYVRA